MNDLRPRVVVTGLGVVSPGGCDVPAFWCGLVAGRSAVRRISRFDTSRFPVRIGGEIGDDLCGELAASVDPSWPALGRIALFASIAGRNALADAGLLDRSRRPSRIGVIAAAGVDSSAHAELIAPCAAAGSGANQPFDGARFADAYRARRLPRTAERRTPGSIAASLARQHQLRGPVSAVMTACSGGAQAIGDALRSIRAGRADAVLAGGADSGLCPMGLASFCLLGVLSKQNDNPAAASRPFDLSRSGFVLGEGAGMMVLESLDCARARGARIYAEVSGFGSSCDAYRVTDQDPEGAGAALAMQRAVQDAGADVGEIAYINAHGTSTKANDRLETLAIKRVFGSHAHRVAISSTKSMLGHATVAAGAIEAVVTALTIAHATIHPTINLDTPDPDCDLDYVPHRARPVPVELALSNSFAFGGQNVALVLRRMAT
jgi:3-oxoacyl-[acyl-carrier-protein] synthase II